MTLVKGPHYWRIMDEDGWCVACVYNDGIAYVYISNILHRFDTVPTDPLRIEYLSQQEAAEDMIKIFS